MFGRLQLCIIISYIRSQQGVAGCMVTDLWLHFFLYSLLKTGRNHMSYVICDFTVRCLDSIIPLQEALVSTAKISSFYLVSVTAQAGLSLPRL